MAILEKIIQFLKSVKKKLLFSKHKKSLSGCLAVMEKIL